MCPVTLQLIVQIYYQSVKKKNEEPAANNDVNQSQLADEIEKILNDIRTLETKKAIKIYVRMMKMTPLSCL